MDTPHQRRPGRFPLYETASSTPGSTPRMPHMIPVTQLESGLASSRTQQTDAQSDIQQSQQHPARPSAQEGNGFVHSLVQAGLSQDSVTALVTAGFTTQALLPLLKVDDIAALGIEPLAQRRLLESLVLQWNNRPRTTGLPVNGSSALQMTPGMDPVLQSLGGLLSSKPAQTIAHTTPGEHYMPPFATHGGKKHLDITDYARCFNPAQDERVLASAEGGIEFLIRGNATGKPKLEDISPLTWMGASLRIMRDLVKRGELAVNDMDRYLTYMEKVADLSAKYTWASLRVYDREFRRWQSQTGVSWTQDNGHLSDAYLFVRQETKQSGTTTALKKQSTATGKGRSQGTPVCRLFNYGKCKYGSSCQYLHKCMAPECSADHPIIQHGSGAPKNGQHQ